MRLGHAHRHWHGFAGTNGRRSRVRSLLLSCPLCLSCGTPKELRYRKMHSNYPVPATAAAPPAAAVRFRDECSVYPQSHGQLFFKGFLSIILLRTFFFQKIFQRLGSIRCLRTFMQCRLSFRHNPIQTTWHSTGQSFKNFSFHLLFSSYHSSS